MSPDEQRLARVVFLISNYCSIPIQRLQILDLASRVGVFSEGLAKLGADVIGVEGRQSNIDQVPDPPMAKYILGDVRTLPTLVNQQFDVTLCLGILYHLEPDDAIQLLRQIRLLTPLLILDTHISLNPTVILGQSRGHWYNEGRAVAPWSSINNQESFWFTPESLLTILHDVGWQAWEIGTKAYPEEPVDRRWYVAV